jgi:cytochrome bd-type quinol oxidase subunit 1
LSAIPIVISGFTGTLMVISVNAWMNHPGGCRLHGGSGSFFPTRFRQPGDRGSGGSP